MQDRLSRVDSPYLRQPCDKYYRYDIVWDILKRRFVIMTSKKKKAIIISIVVAVVLVVLLCSEINIYGVYFYSPIYFDTPQSAILDKEDIYIDSDAAIIEMDETNSFYFAVTDDGEFLMAQMKNRGEKYCFTGTYVIYTFSRNGDWSQENGICYSSYPMYNGLGTKFCDIDIAVIFDVSLVPESAEADGYTVFSGKIDSKDYFVIYKMS
jgi:hypothetical protein